jgi:hypothetical protein
MYKRNKAWMAMLKLVQQHRREQLPQAHLMVAQVGMKSWLWQHWCLLRQHCLPTQMGMGRLAATDRLHHIQYP